MFVLSCFRGAEAPWLAALASAVVAAAVSSVGVVIGELWADLIEMALVGDVHLSYRAWRISWSQHRTGLFMAGIVLFGLIAAMTSRRARRSTPP